MDPVTPVTPEELAAAVEAQQLAAATASAVEAGKAIAGILDYATSFEGRSRFQSTQPTTVAVINEWEDMQSLEPDASVRGQIQQNIDNLIAMEVAGISTTPVWVAYSNWLNGIDDGHSLGSGWDGSASTFLGSQSWGLQIKKTGHF